MSFERKQVIAEATILDMDHFRRVHELLTALNVVDETLATGGRNYESAHGLVLETAPHALTVPLIFEGRTRDFVAFRFRPTDGALSGLLENGKDIFVGEESADEVANNAVLEAGTEDNIRQMEVRYGLHTDAVDEAWLEDEETYLN